MDAQSIALVRLNLVPGLGPVRIERLVSRFGSAAGALGASAAGWVEAGVPAAIAEAALSDEAARATEEEVAWAERTGSRILTPRDRAYPTLLRSIPIPPPVLYARGDPSSLAGNDPAVAIVGTRTPTGYGRETATRIASGVAAAGVVVVSGLARGIDSAAHRGALDSGGKTVAVLASGFERPYPTEDPSLPDRIAEAGALLSEFPLGIAARRGHFPRRNRLISGLALGTLVVEAAEKSGSLLTAQWALDQNRTVMAVPGRADNPMARGSNGLIRRGAALVEDAEQLFAELDLTAARATASPAPEGGLLARIGSAGATLDELSDATGSPVEEILSELLRLEIEGRILLGPGGIYRRLGRA